MPDQKTLAHYAANSETYAEKYKAGSPQRMYDLAKVYFKFGGITYDIGAGTGRDSEWLNEAGFQCSAVDPVLEFVNLCKARARISKVVHDELPSLKKVTNNSADNVFCSTVLMHLPSNELLSSVYRLVEILKNDGVLLLSWRDSTTDSELEGERLFSRYTGQQVCDILVSYGCEILYYRHEYSDASRPKIPFYIIMARKKAKALVGLARIQSIIVRDDKTSTYKLALLRSLCEIAQNESFSVTLECKVS